MNDYKQQWNRCLQLIRENIGKDTNMIPVDDAAWVFDTWFAPVTFESYEPATGTLMLNVPDSHVCDYIEHYRMPLWSWALRSTFGQQVRLSYRIQQQSSDYPDGFLSDVSPERPKFAVPDARKKLEDGLRRVIGDRFQWLPDYNKVATWLSDNKGRGLLCVGTSGLGKSVLCCEVLPTILGGQDWQKKIIMIQAKDIRSRLDELLHARCVVIDDLGKESRKYYGNTDNSFFDLCDASEHGGPLLIITTNLSTTPVQSQFRNIYPSSIQETYGTEVLDRLKSITRMVRLEGPSLRA